MISRTVHRQYWLFPELLTVQYKNSWVNEKYGQWSSFSLQLESGLCVLIWILFNRSILHDPCDIKENECQKSRCGAHMKTQVFIH